MKLRDILSPSLAAARKPYTPLMERCRADDSDFCRMATSRGWLTDEQMARAAERYRLGKSRSGRCIYWMTDRLGRVLDGHIGDSWVSVLMKAREPRLLRDWHAEHGLFGGMLLRPESSRRHQPARVAVVEREPSAVILSELFPRCIWMATAYPLNCNAHTLSQLSGCEVTLFPPTDETMDTYLAWLQVADDAERAYRLHIQVSKVLEEHATPDQKHRGIDIADFLLEPLLKPPNDGFEASKHPV